MKINTLKIKNFRGIPDMEISLERISFFTGPCGAGKTSVLKAFNFALTGGGCQQRNVCWKSGSYV